LRAYAKLFLNVLRIYEDFREGIIIWRVFRRVLGSMELLLLSVQYRGLDLYQAFPSSYCLFVTLYNYLYLGDNNHDQGIQRVWVLVTGASVTSFIIILFYFLFAVATTRNRAVDAWKDKSVLFLFISLLSVYFIFFSD
jgi:hypothetical protein